jgi:hypothetical protein
VISCPLIHPVIYNLQNVFYIIDIEISSDFKRGDLRMSATAVSPGDGNEKGKQDITSPTGPDDDDPPDERPER